MPSASDPVFARRTFLRYSSLTLGLFRCRYARASALPVLPAQSPVRRKRVAAKARLHKSQVPGAGWAAQPESLSTAARKGSADADTARTLWLPWRRSNPVLPLPPGRAPASPGLAPSRFAGSSRAPLAAARRDRTSRGAACLREPRTPNPAAKRLAARFPAGRTPCAVLPSDRGARLRRHQAPAPPRGRIEAQRASFPRLDRHKRQSWPHRLSESQPCLLKLFSRTRNQHLVILIQGDRVRWPRRLLVVPERHHPEAQHEQIANRPQIFPNALKNDT